MDGNCGDSEPASQTRDGLTVYVRDGQVVRYACPVCGWWCDAGVECGRAHPVGAK